MTVHAQEDIRSGETRHPFYSVNPVAKLAAVVLLAACLILTIDPVSAGVALLLELPLIAMMGVPARTFWLRTLPVWIAAPLAGVTILLYGQNMGQVYFEFWAMRISDGSIGLALATMLRVLALALPAVVLFITIDISELADGLAQVWRLPARFVLGALAAMRLIALFVEDWRFLALARRARGVADSGTLRRLAGQAFALLVLSIRRGSKLATAMEARGFGSDIPRTWARESRFGIREWLVVIVGALIGVAGAAAAIVTGEWQFIVR